jgi:hypothetical protein
MIGAARNYQYLSWRYSQHPCFRYRFITVAEGNRTGLLIWRLETIRRLTSVGLEEVDRIARVLEFLPVSSNNAKQLLSSFVSALSEAKALGADYYGYYGESREWLQEFGFLEVSSHPDGGAIPSRFQPLEGNGGQILSSVFIQDNVPTCSTDLGCGWYWTKSDSDQDRPN